MRNTYLLLTLLVVNILVFFWEATPKKEDAETAVDEVEEQNSPSDETTQADQAEPSEQESTATTNESGLRKEEPTRYKTCLLVGPFTDLSHVIAAKRWLSRRRTSVWLSEAPTQNAREFLVYVPVTDRTATPKMLSDIQAKAVGNVSLTHDNDGSDLITFGHYPSEVEANKRLGELSLYGIHATLRSSADSKPNYWLNVASKRDRELLAETATRFRDRARPKPVDCGQIRALQDSSSG